MVLQKQLVLRFPYLVYTDFSARKHLSNDRAFRGSISHPSVYLQFGEAYVGVW